MPATVSLDGLEVDQQYYVWMMLPEGDGSRSIQSTWIVAKMSGDQLDEDFALRMVINSMSNLATDLVYGSDAKRPDWMREARTYPLLNASGRAVVDWVETRRKGSAKRIEEEAE